MKGPLVFRPGALFLKFNVGFLFSFKMIPIFNLLTHLKPFIIMKKVLLPLLVMATMFACKSPETKTAETSVNPDDKEAGSFVSIDEKTATFKRLLEAAMKNDTAYFREVFVDTLIVTDGFAGNVDSLNKMKPNGGGLDALIKGDSNLHTLYDDIVMTTNSGAIKTFTFADGRVLSGYWGIWTGKGKFTNTEARVPLHMIAWWEGDKIVRLYRQFDPASLKSEIAASQKK